MKYEDNSQKILDGLAMKEEKILQAIGLKWQEISTKIATDKKVVDTGRLRASLSYITPTMDSGLNKQATSTESKSSDSITGLKEKNTVIVGTNVEYAAEQELGTRYFEGRPFIKPAITDYKEAYQRIAEQIFKE